MQKKLKPWETPFGIILSRYYRGQARMERLRKIEKTIKEDIWELQETIRYIMNTPKITVKYGFSPGGGGDGDPQAQMILKLEKETKRVCDLLPEKTKRLLSIQQRIHDLREWMVPFDLILGRLTDEERRILEMKYHYRRSNYVISNNLHCDEGKIRYMHRKIMFYIQDLLESKKIRIFSAKRTGFRDRMIV